jgi:hypothetical protein
MAGPRVADGGDGLQTQRVTANISNKQSLTVISGGSAALKLGGELTSPHSEWPTYYDLVVPCEDGKELSSSIKVGEFLDWLKKDFSP